MRAVLSSALLCVFVLAQALAQADDASPFVASPPRTHVEVITGSAAEYTVQVGGLLDMDNTMTRECSNRHIAFQNNVSLTIANTGAVPVVNPRLVTNGKGRWWNLDELLDEFTEGAANDQERIYFIWEHVRQNRHHDDPLFARDEFHDPVRWLNVYGGGLCDDAGLVGAALFYHLGFNEANGGKDPFTRCLHGHMQCEVFYDGDYQFIDIDENVFFLDRENRKPVSGDALARDHDLAKREIPYGPIFGSWDSSQNNAALFGVDDDRTGYGPTGHAMDYTLRPGEAVVFRWDNIGKWAYNNSSGPHRYYGNSKIVYQPRPGLLDGAAGFEALDGALVCTVADATVVVETATCYGICGGLASARFANGRDETVFKIESSLNGDTYTTVWETSGTEAQASASLDEALDVHDAAPRRRHYVRFSVVNGPGATVSDLRIETDLTASPMALPRLNAGTNQAGYLDETQGPHEVTVTHEWIECDSVVPPAPPERPLSPAADEVVRATYVPFRWPEVEGCDAYHVRVSRRRDFAYPYRPNYDLVVPANEHLVLRRGMFSPGETYHWRVRPRLACGVWGAWGPTWTFQWDGPMVPKDLDTRYDGDAIVITWQANPRGARPVRYDVYGSNERGFSVNREPHSVVGLGEVPGNFLASTTDTEMVVVAPDPQATNMNKAYYRVVPVDAHGVEGCPSDFVEMPRPYVFTRPMTAPVAGQSYEYQMQTIRTIGDLQSRYIEPRAAYWEKEEYRFVLESGPAWLRLDETTGLLTGTPSADDLGKARVVVRVTTSCPHEVPEDSKSGKCFQRRRTQSELQRECTHEFVLTTTLP